MTAQNVTNIFIVGEKHQAIGSALASSETGVVILIRSETITTTNISVDKNSTSNFPWKSQVFTAALLEWHGIGEETKQEIEYALLRKRTIFPAPHVVSSSAYAVNSSATAVLDISKYIRDILREFGYYAVIPEDSWMH